MTWINWLLDIFFINFFHKMMVNNKFVIQFCCERNEISNMNKIFKTLNIIRIDMGIHIWKNFEDGKGQRFLFLHTFPILKFLLMSFYIKWLGKIDLGFSSCWNSKTRFNQKTLDNGTPSFSLNIHCSTFVKVLLRVSPCTHLVQLEIFSWELSLWD